MTDGSDPFDYGRPSPPGETYGPPGGGYGAHRPYTPPEDTGSPWAGGAVPHSAAPGPTTRSFPGPGPTSSPYDSPWQPASTNTPYEPPAFGGTDTVGRPPTVWLVVALVLGLVAAVVAFVFGRQVAVAMTAWALAGPVAIGLLAVFSRLDLRQRARPLYAAPTWVPGLYSGAILVAFVGIGLSAWRIAEWAGQL